MTFAVFLGAKVNDRLFSLLNLCGTSCTYRVLNFLRFPLVLPHGSRTISRKFPSAQYGIQTFPVYPPLGDDKDILCFVWVFQRFSMILIILCPKKYWTKNFARKSLFFQGFPCFPNGFPLYCVLENNGKIVFSIGFTTFSYGFNYTVPSGHSKNVTFSIVFGGFQENR